MDFVWNRAAVKELLRSQGVQSAVTEVAGHIAADANGGPVEFHVQAEVDRVGATATVGPAPEDLQKFLAVEFGTTRTPPHPHLRPAASKQRGNV